MDYLIYVINQSINGLKLGSVYALTAIGYSIVYGILRLINFAHGDILMLGVYAAFFLLSLKVIPLAAVVLGAIGFAMVMGLAVERIAYRPLRAASEESTLISSLAVSVFIQNLAVMMFSPQRRAFRLPAYLTELHQFGFVRISTMNIAIFAVTALVLVILSLVIKKTRIGMAMRACSDNLAAARLVGIKVDRVVAFAFLVGSGLAALAGIMLAGEYKTIDPLMGMVPGLKAFVAAVLGGIGSFAGAALGGIILGLAEMLFAGLLPPGMTMYRDALVFVILILVLLVRPNGILGSSDGKRS